MKSDTLNEFLIKETLGTGTFSKVKLGIHKNTGEKVAIKILDKEKIQDRDDLIRIQREIKIITSLNNPNVIHIKNFCDTKNFYYIIMEYCQGGELFNYIVNKSFLTEDESANFYYQLINGVEYIHSKGVVHRDLKPENLLLDHENRLKIIDFGLSNFFNNKLLRTPCGSPCYASPEMVSGQEYNGFCIDVWSTGIILFAMLCGYLPFEDDSNEILFDKISKCKLTFPSRITKDAGDLLKKILVVNSDKRITIKQIKEHQFYLKGKAVCSEIERQKREKHSMLNEIDNNCTYIPVQTNYSNKDKQNEKNKKSNKDISKKKSYHITTTTTTMADITKKIQNKKKRPFSTEHTKYNSKDQIVHTCSSMTNTIMKDNLLNINMKSQEFLKSIQTMRKKNNKTTLFTNNDYNAIHSKRLRKLTDLCGIKPHFDNQKQITINSGKKSFSNLSTNSGSQKAALNISPHSLHNIHINNNNHTNNSKSKRTQRQKSNQIQLKNHLILSKINQCLTLSNINTNKYNNSQTRNYSPKKLVNESNRLSSPKNFTQLKFKHMKDKELIQKQIKYLLTETESKVKKCSNNNNKNNHNRQLDSKFVEYFACPTSSNKTNRYSITNANKIKGNNKAISNINNNNYHMLHSNTPKVIPTKQGIENHLFKSILLKSSAFNK